jgi:hypothetical protein
MKKKLEELSLLKSNWDSYGGKPMTESALAEAELLLNAFERIQAVEPSVVPCSNGGIQIEWHRNGYTLEIEISPEGQVSEVYCAKTTNA